MRFKSAGVYSRFFGVGIKDKFFERREAKDK